ncbi:MAG: hypothetical protein K2H64_12760 [Desulfovibrio sp.]|nr:hypothetical protein [Desulfovibrio sp.]
MAFYVYRYGTSLRAAKEAWEKINDETLVWIAGTGRKELAWIWIQKDMEEFNEGYESQDDVMSRLSRLDPHKSIKELRPFIGRRPRSPAN